MDIRGELLRRRKDNRWIIGALGVLLLILSGILFIIQRGRGLPTDQASSTDSGGIAISVNLEPGTYVLQTNRASDGGLITETAIRAVVGKVTMIAVSPNR